jgi:hypothetical protein
MCHLGQHNHSERDRFPRISDGAVPANKLKGEFAPIDLPVHADGKLLTGQPLSQRRSQLEGFFRRAGENSLVRLSPISAATKKRRNGCSN